MNVGNVSHHNLILADGRWIGEHGIGRFTHEVLPRLKNCDILTKGPWPLSFKNLWWLPKKLRKTPHKVYFNPGFNPLLYSPIPFVFIIHDLNHLHFQDSAKFLKKIYYYTLIKYTAKRAFKILTASEYSRVTLLNWLKLPEEKIVVAGNGISSQFTPEGKRYLPGFPYLLHVGNTKLHKNVIRLIPALARANISSEIKLILTGKQTKELAKLIHQHQLENRVIFSGTLNESELAEYYRGALAVLFPSLYEGFGLPVVEGMASGTPVLTSNVTSLPEISGDAALLIDPTDIDSIAAGIERIVNDTILRNQLIKRGLERAKLFTWDETAKRVQQVLNEAIS